MVEHIEAVPFGSPSEQRERIVTGAPQHSDITTLPYVAGLAV